MPVQVNVKATHADGSVKHAVLIAKQPTLQAGESQSFMLTTNTASNMGSVVDLVYFPSSSVTVSLSISQPVTQTVDLDVSKALSDALSAKTASYWLQGPLATQARVVVPVVSSFRLAFDVTLFSDNSYSVDMQFLNDIAMSASGGTLMYAVTISAGGQTFYSNTNLTQFQYQTWHHVYHSDQVPQVNVQYDVLALIQSNTIHPYNVSMGISQALVNDITNRMTDANWGKPLSPNGITQYMPMTGGRADIGPFPLWTAAWIVSQHDAARRYMLSWGDAAGSTPLNMFAKNESRWLNVFDYPFIFLDRRCSPYLVCPTQFSEDKAWNLDTAHFPSMAYVPYLITGSRYYLDRMEAIAAWVGVAYYPTNRNANGKTELGLLVNGNQLRGTAWGLREVILSSYISPDDSIMRAYYDKMVFNNLSWLNNQTADWQSKTGETYGVILSFSYASGSDFIIPPWQLDYFASTLSIAARQGNELALKYLQWSRNWNVGRFTHSPDFNPKNGVAYNLYYANGTTYFTTWKDLQQIQVATNHDVRQFSDGTLNQLGIMTLVMYQVSFPEDNEAYSAWEWLSTSSAAQVLPADYQSDPTFSMAPYNPRVNPPGSGIAGENQPGNQPDNQPSASSAGPTSVTSSAGMNIASLALIALLLVIN